MTNYRIKRTVMGQLPFGTDLLEGLSEIVQRENISLGRLHGLGATTFARVAFYDQNTKTYNPPEFSSGRESLRWASPARHETVRLRTLHR